MSAECRLDFARSFLRFSTTRVHHTPRLTLVAACTLEPLDGDALTFYLTRPCIAEAMYVPTGLIHEPVAQFRLIAAPGEQFLMIKHHADAALDQLSAHRFGDAMPTHDGQGATVVELDVSLGTAPATPIAGYEAFREALLANCPVVGRTTYEDPATGGRVILDYPADTINVAHGREAWQVDAGPIVMPLATTAGDLPVSRLRPAYLVYNRFDYAEYVVLEKVPLGGDAITRHYAQPRPLSCRHQLWALQS